jgi:malate dehydrogenase
MLKISLVGFGNIGTAIANEMSLNAFNGTIAVYDRSFEVAKGKILDITHSNNIRGVFTKLNACRNLEEAVRDANLIVITAGAKRKENMTREDLIAVNKSIILDVANVIKKEAKNAFVIIVTNPVDLMTYHFIKESQFSSNFVIGMAGSLDSIRFRTLLYDLFIKIFQENNIADQLLFDDIKGSVVGFHNDYMIPLLSSITIKGRDIYYYLNKNIVTKEQIDSVINQTRSMGMSISQLMGTSAYLSPASAVVKLANAYLFDKVTTETASFLLQKDKNLSDIAMSVEVIINKEGAKIIKDEFLFTQEEEELMKKSINLMRSLR